MLRNKNMTADFFLWDIFAKSWRTRDVDAGASRLLFCMYIYYEGEKYFSTVSLICKRLLAYGLSSSFPLMGGILSFSWYKCIKQFLYHAF